MSPSIKNAALLCAMSMLFGSTQARFSAIFWSGDDVGVGVRTIVTGTDNTGCHSAADFDTDQTPICSVQITEQGNGSQVNFYSDANCQQFITGTQSVEHVLMSPLCAQSFLSFE
ncbi:hypothetical protein F5884DRAFT_836349 [Xylogone sp. PMI_703]|nr:hypothetical protein F5884DRAFT_836349 [Xylogone sp. PMI_703]